MKKLDGRDWCVLAGTVSTTYGLYLIYAPLAYLAAGAVLIRVGLPRKEVK